MPEDRTTVYLERDSYRALKQLARDRGVSAASLVREAVSEYAARHASRRQPRSVAVFRTDDPLLASRSEELLEGFGEER